MSPIPRCFLLLLTVSFFALGCGQLAGDGPPVCSIETPSEAVRAYPGDEIEFVVHATDGGTSADRLRVAWSSSLGDALPDGTLDEGGRHRFSTRLSVGEHSIQATVTDLQGETCFDTVPVTVSTGGIPTIVIETPRDDGFYYQDRPLLLRSVVADAEDAPSELRVHWALVGGEGLAENLEPDGDGVTIIERSFGVGPHELSARVVDTHGNVATATVTPVVGGPNQPPVCDWIEPLDGSVHSEQAPLTLLASTTDPDVPSTLLTTVFAKSGAELATVTPNDSGRSTADVRLPPGTHELTVTVTDEVGLSCDEVVTVTIDALPTADVSLPGVADVPSDNLDLLLEGLVSDPEDPPELLEIAWHSDVDGFLSDVPADAGGTVSDTIAPLTAGPHLLTLEVTDSAGGVATDTVEVMVNAAPSAPTAQLDPVTPVTVDDLVSLMVSPGVDPEGAQLVHVWSWLKDGGPVPTYDDLTTVPAGATTKGEVWTVEIRAFDGHTHSAPGTASVTVDNTPPQGGSAEVTPALGTNSTTFALTTAGWYDDDGDAEGYLYQWVLDGMPVPGETGPTYVPGPSALPGTPLHCELTPWDGQDIAPMFLSAPAYINEPATVATVDVGPTTAYETTTLTGTHAGLTDPEGAATTVLHQWFKDPSNPTPIAGATGPTLDGNSFDHFDEVWLSVTVDDGVEIGPATTSAVIPILNTPPSTVSPSVTPSILYTDTQAVCVGGAVTDPDNDTLALQYAWEVDGSEVVGQTTSTLDGTIYFDKAQSVRCIVTPWDGHDLGASEESALHIVTNSPPSAPVVTIDPANPADHDTLGCTATTPSYDADGDAVSYSRSWSQATGATPYTAENLLAGLTSIGDTWTCTMTPWDGQATGPAGSDTVTVQAEQQMDPGAYGSTYSQQVQTRGFWFTAPQNLAITGLFVANETHDGQPQNVQIVLLPANFASVGGTTGTTLFYAAHQPSSTPITMNVPVLSGDVVGILGARGTSTMHSLYGDSNAPVTTSLDGVPIQLHRLEYDANLWNTQAGSLTDNVGPIGRVWMDYIP